MSKNIGKEFSILLKTAIDSIDPAKLIRKAVNIEQNNLFISNKLLFENQNDEIKRFDLNQNVYIAAFGKAALGMSIELEKLVGAEHIVKGISIIPYNDAKKFKSLNEQVLDEIFPIENSKIKFYYGAKYNLPDMQSYEASKKVYEMCSSLKKGDLLISLISGGGSALLTLPENISLTDNFDLKLNTIKKVVQAGATINELNTVRSCLSLVKGGKLALCTYPAQTISLIISDVIDDPLEIISSGPTCAHLVNSQKMQSTKALNVLNKFNILNKIPEQVKEFLLEKSLKEENEFLVEDFIKNNKVFNYLIGNNKLATLAILNQLDNLAYDYKRILTNKLYGEAKLVGYAFAYLAFSLVYLKKNNLNLNIDSILDLLKSKKEIQNFDSILEIFKNNFKNLFENELFEKMSIKKENFKICLIAGGETTVDLKDLNSKIKSVGGRNQEMTLAFEFMFKQFNISKDIEQIKLLFSSFGSDGIDGPTDAAGAFFSFENEQTDLENISEINSYLLNHDSYNYFSKKNRLIKTGPTGTNVSDLQILLLEI